MIKKFDKKYVFLKLIYLRRQNHETGAVTFEYKHILHAFDNENRAEKYTAETVKHCKECLGGQKITYAEALKEFGEHAVIKAIEINEAIENFEKRGKLNC